MKTSRYEAFLFVLFVAASTAAGAPVGTAITYQGQLSSGGSPANGSFNMVFKLFDAATLGSQIGPTLTFDGAGGNPPAISVSNGLFTVQLGHGRASADFCCRAAMIQGRAAPAAGLTKLAFHLAPRSANPVAVVQGGIEGGISHD